VADDSVDTVSYQRVSRLNRDQAAEAFAQHKHWPDPQYTSSGEEYNTEPANRVTVNRPHLFAIRVRRQICIEKPDYHEDGYDPAVAAGLTHTRAEISAGEKRQTGKRKKNCHERDQRRMREERPKPSPTKNGKASIDTGADRNEHKSSSRIHTVTILQRPKRTTEGEPV